MAQWNYDADNDCLWVIGTMWTYDPDAPNFKKIVPTNEVPLPLRELLETEAKRLTNVILGPGEQQAMDQRVEINNKFAQDQITDRVVLGNAMFGSDGAASCLIVFATGTDAQGQQVAVGAHLSNQVYHAPYETVETMLDNLGDDTENISFDIFGGEVGRNTDNNPAITMDYSRYYPFFQEIASHAAQGVVTIRSYNFPSNGPTQRTGAAINKDGVVAVFHH